MKNKDLNKFKEDAEVFFLVLIFTISLVGVNPPVWLWRSFFHFSSSIGYNLGTQWDNMEIFLLAFFGIAISTLYFKYAPMHDILIALQYEKLRDKDWGILSKQHYSWTRL